MSNARYAIYWAPDTTTALWRLGSHWLGYDAATGADLGCPTIDGHDSAWVRALTDEPRRYGLHATLKPPMRLSPRADAKELDRVARTLAAQQSAFDLPRLELRRTGRFLALRPVAPSEDMDQLAAACVAEFDALRMPPSEAEIRKRAALRLSERQRELLERWGYPYVFDEWRFHLSLTRPLTDEQAQALAGPLRTFLLPGLVSPPLVDSICVYVRDEGAERFRLAARYGFDGTVDPPKGLR